MKNFTYKLWAKIFAFVMLIASIGIAIFMGVCFFEAESRDAYAYDTYEDYLEAYNEQLGTEAAFFEGQHFRSIFESNLGQIDENMMDSFVQSGVYFRVFEEGKEVFSNVQNDELKSFETKQFYYYDAPEIEIRAFKETLLVPEQFDYGFPIQENLPEGEFQTGDGIIYSEGDTFEGMNGRTYEVNSDGNLVYYGEIIAHTGELDITVHFSDEQLAYIYSNYSSEISVKFNYFLYDYRDVFVPIAVVSAVMSLFWFIMLTVMAGRKLGHKGVYLNTFDRIPFEFLLIIPLACIAFFGAHYYNGMFELMIIVSVLGVFAVYMSLVARIKAGSWWKNTIIYRIIRLFKRIWRFTVSQFTVNSLKNPLVIRALLIYFAYKFFQLCAIMIMGGHAELAVAAIVEIPFLGFVIFIICTWFTRLHKGADRIANGDFETKTDITHMKFDFLDFAEKLNSVGEGMNLAMEDKLKSERLKTELITNVSHDIKTPLTSIINYVDLIKKEETENEKIVEYAEVLDRQSQKLNRLIVDLVEASKISSGNVSVNAETTDLCVIAEQIKGEYDEKLASKKLNLVVRTPENPVNVQADSRHLQRIFDNLMGNVLKYSLEGTRVYIDVLENEISSQITLKNTSATELNITADELMERFVRGDSSRNTDGNGLGLSIAQSLAKVQGATLDIIVDGDLFKVILTF